MGLLGLAQTLLDWENMMNVMVVDDDRECLESLESALRLNGFYVRSFQSPDQALHAYNPATDDVVISDYHLPGMTGADLLEKIRCKRMDAPVIIISGDPQKKIERLSLKAGACAFFRKPLNIKEIINKLKAYTHS